MAAEARRRSQPSLKTRAAEEGYGVQDCLHIVMAAEECDATGDATSAAVRLIKKSNFGRQII